MPTNPIDISKVKWDDSAIDTSQVQWDDEEVAVEEPPKQPSFSPVDAFLGASKPQNELDIAGVKPIPEENIGGISWERETKTPIRNAVNNQEEADKINKDNAQSYILTDAIKKGLLSGEIADMMAIGKTPTRDDIVRISEIKKQEQALMPKHGALKAYQDAEGTDAAKIAFSSPQAFTEIASDIILTSLTSSLRHGITRMAAGAVEGAALGSVVPGLGTVGGGLTGILGGYAVANYNIGVASDVLGSYQDAGVDVTNPDALEAAFNDPEITKQAKEFAIKRNVPIAAFDLLSSGIAGKVAKVLPKGGGGVIGKVGEVAAQSGTSMLGETAGQVTSGQELEFKDILSEGIGELGSGAPEIITGTIIESKKSGGDPTKEIIKLSQSLPKENRVETANELIDVSVGTGEITNDQATELKNQFAQTVEADSKIPESVPEENRAAIIPLITEKGILQDAIIKLTESKLTLDDAFHPDIDKEIAKTEKRVEEIKGEITEVAKRKIKTEDNEPTIEQSGTEAVTTDAELPITGTPDEIIGGVQEEPLPESGADDVSGGITDNVPTTDDISVPAVTEENAQSEQLPKSPTDEKSKGKEEGLLESETSTIAEGGESQGDVQPPSVEKPVTSYEKINYAKEGNDKWNSYIKRKMMAGEKLEGSQKEITDRIRKGYEAEGYRIEGQFAIKGEPPKEKSTSKEEKKAALTKLKEEFFNKNKFAPSALKDFESGIKSGEYKIDDLPSYESSKDILELVEKPTTKKSKPVTKESAPTEKTITKKQLKQERDTLLKRTPVNAREAILQYFSGGGRISTADIKRELGVSGSDLKSKIWAHGNKAPSVDRLVQDLKEELSVQSGLEVDEDVLRNEIIDVLHSHGGRSSMITELKNIAGKENVDSVYDDATLEEMSRLEEDPEHQLAQAIEEQMSPEELDVLDAQIASFISDDGEARWEEFKNAEIPEELIPLIDQYGLEDLQGEDDSQTAEGKSDTSDKDIIAEEKSSGTKTSKGRTREELLQELEAANTELASAESDYNKAKKALDKNLQDKQSNLFQGGNEQKLFDDTADIKAQADKAKKKYDAAKEKADNLQKLVNENAPGQQEIPIEEDESVSEEPIEDDEGIEDKQEVNSPEEVKKIKSNDINTVRDLANLDAEEQSGLLSGAVFSSLKKGDVITVGRKKYTVDSKSKPTQNTYYTKDNKKIDYKKSTLRLKDEAGKTISGELWEYKNGSGTWMGRGGTRKSDRWGQLSRDIEGDISVDLINENNKFHEPSDSFKKAQEFIDDFNEIKDESTSSEPIDDDDSDIHEARTEGARRKKKDKPQPTGVFDPTIPNKPTADKKFNPIDLPELIQVAKDISGGKIPRIQTLIKSLGYFNSKLKEIALSRDLFDKKNYDALLKVLAHEIGHFIDFLPDQTLKRGNILGRLASLKDFMEKYLPFKPGDLGALTKDDIKRIRAEVKKAQQPITKEIDEEIIKTVGITPQDVLDVWNSTVAGHNNPELLDYIKTLSDGDKKSIVKDALKGITSDMLKHLQTVIREKTGKKITITEYPDINKAVREAIIAEVKKRKLFVDSEVYNEAYSLSKEWRPFNEKGAKESELKYRKSGKEVYADMISILFNSPGILEEKAPKFFQAFMNYLSAKPEFKQVYEDMNELIADEAKLQSSRVSATKENYKAARDKRAEIQQKEKARRSAKKLWDTFKQQFISISSAILKKLPNDKKGAGLSTKERVRNSIEQMFMWKSKTALLMDEYKKVTDKLVEAGIDTDDMGVIVESIRNMSPTREDKANPLGFQLEEQNLDRVQTILDQYTVPQQELIGKALIDFYEINFNVMQDAYDNGLISADMWQQVQQNKYNYATFKPVKYIDERIQTAKIFNVTGTLEGIANPFTETMIKTAFIQRASERNKAVRETVEALEKHSPDSVKQTEYVNGTPSEQLKPGEKYVHYRKSGKPAVFITESDIANVFEFVEPQQISLLVKGMNVLSAPLKAAFTKYNPGFVFYNNLIKDGRRSLSNVVSILSASDKLKAVNFISLFPEYAGKFLTSIKDAKSVQSKTPTDIAKRMLLHGAINPESAIFSKYNPEQSAMGNIFSHYENTQEHLGLEDKKESVWEMAKEALLFDLEQFIAGPGRILELTNKIAGYKILEKRLGPEAAAYYTRNFVGTPNYSEKTGTDVSFIPFAKVIMQGLRNDVDLMSGKKTAASYWLFKALTVMLPAALTTMAIKGAFDSDDDEEGKKLSDWFAKLSKYQRLNTGNIPLGFTEDGKARGLTVPMDDISRLQYALMMELFEEDDAKDKARTIGQQLIQSTPLPNFQSGYALYLNWFDFIVNGNNPYDDFYKRDIISRRNFDLGGMAATGDMGKYTLNQLGLRLPNKEFGEKTTTKEKVLSLPLVNRIYKETSSGDYEYLRKVTKEVTKENAQRLQNLDDKIEEILDAEAEGIISDKKYSPVAINALANKAYYSYKAEHPEAKIKDKEYIFSKMKLLTQKQLVKHLPVASAVLNAQSTAEKQAILEEFKKRVSSKDYDEVIRVLKSSDINYK